MTMFKRRLPIKYFMLISFMFLSFMFGLGITSQTVYGAEGGTICAEIFLDTILPTTEEPTVDMGYGFVTVTTNQEDSYDENSVGSGIKLIEYGYKLSKAGADNTDEAAYTWQTDSMLYGLTLGESYDFATRVTDYAGNKAISTVTVATVENSMIPLLVLNDIYNISTGNKSYIKASDRVSISFLAKTENYESTSLTVDDITVKVGDDVVTPTVKTLSSPIDMGDGVKWSLTLSGISGNGELSIFIPENKVLNSRAQGNVETTLDTNAIVDNISPSNASVSINNGESTTNNKNVLVTISATGADYIYISNTNVAPSENDLAWIEYIEQKYHELVGDIGTNTVYVWIKDLAGNIVGPVSDSIEITNTVSTISSSIFLDDQLPDTASPNVSASNGIVKIVSMQKDIYKDGVKSGIETIAYGYKASEDSEYTWIAENQTNAINVTNEYDFVTKVRDAAGNEATSEVTSVSIEEDTVPKLEITKIYNLSTYNAAYIKEADRIQLVLRANTKDYFSNDLKAEDLIFTVGNEVITPTTVNLSKGIVTDGGIVWKLTIAGISGNGLLAISIPENKVVNGKYEGNVETILNTGAVVDNMAPSNNSVVINNGDASTEAINVTLTINSTGANYIYISNDQTAPGENNSGWAEYVTSRFHTLKGENGANNVYVWFKDLAGNIAGYATDSINVSTSNMPIQSAIFLDTVAPDDIAPFVNPVNRDVKLVSNQKDVNQDGVKSGIAKIEYGYKLSGSSDEYKYQNTDIIEEIIGDKEYDFVTKATDLAGNVKESKFTAMLIEADTTPVFKFDYKKNVSTSNSLYAKASDILEIVFSVSSSRYDYSILKAEDIKVTVGGAEVVDLEKDLLLLESTPNGEKWKLILNNITGNGELLVEISENVAFDTAISGNVSLIMEPLITVDNIAPENNTISLQNGATETITQNVLANLTSTGASYMYLSNEEVELTEFSSEWTEYTNMRYHMLSSEYGTKTVYAYFKDAAGNISEMISDEINYVKNNGVVQSEIFLDTVAPTTTAPTLLFSTYVTTNCHQEDPYADGGYKSGIAKVEYGYRLNGSTDEYTYKDSNILQNVPSADYYEFVTRATDGAGNTSVSEKTVEYVDLTDIYVDVLFDAGEQTVTPKYKTYKYGDKYTDLPTPTTSEELGFIGWYTEKNGEGQKIIEGMKIEKSYSHTLNAYLRFEMADIKAPRAGSVVINNDDLNANSNNVTLDIYAEDDSNMQVWISNDGVTGTIVDFNLNTTINITDRNYTVGTDLTNSNSKNTTNTDNVFRITNWPLTDGDGNKRVYVVFNDSYGNTSALTGYNTIEITYDLNGEEGIELPVKKTLKGLDVRLPIATSKNNRKFIGWSLNSNSETPDYAGNTIVTFSENTQLYAIFE